MSLIWQEVLLKRTLKLVVMSLCLVTLRDFKPMYVLEKLKLFKNLMIKILRSMSFVEKGKEIHPQ
jgi:hypothetical protein